MASDETQDEPRKPAPRRKASATTTPRAKPVAKAAATASSKAAAAKPPATAERRTGSQPVAKAATSTPVTLRPVVPVAVVPPVPTIKVVEDAPAKQGDAVVSLKKQELVKRVVAASGVKKKDVKTVVEATLLVMGAALSQGEELILHPFGKAKVNRKKIENGGEMMILRLKRQDASKESLAQDDEDD